MAFSFRFNQMLNLASHEEAEVKRRLAIKDGQIADIEAKIARNVEEYSGGLEEKAHDLLAGRMERIRLYYPFLLRLQKAREYHLEEKERLVAQREKIIAELAEKRRVRKTYEKIRERDENAYRKEQLRLDQKRLDSFTNRPTTHDRENGNA
ncbi:hypothetical protein AUK22_08155 [bacterium CG2_30_54_10]|nr:MAG: hypothetical protein AUK22_08155 [bacterium CG2_30_54_10]